MWYRNGFKFQYLRPEELDMLSKVHTCREDAVDILDRNEELLDILRHKIPSPRYMENNSWYVQIGCPHCNRVQCKRCYGRDACSYTMVIPYETGRPVPCYQFAFAGVTAEETTLGVISLSYEPSNARITVYATGKGSSSFTKDYNKSYIKAVCIVQGHIEWAKYVLMQYEKDS